MPRFAAIVGSLFADGILQRYDQQSALYWCISGGAIVAFVWWALLPFIRNLVGKISSNGESGVKSDRFIALAMGAVVLAGRWPFLLFRSYFNPDESQQIAGAITLAHRPWFWLAVDGHTAGPMDFYFLCLPRFWRGPIDYSTARASALVLVVGILFFSYKLLRLRMTPSIARAAIAPLVIFFAWVSDEDFVEISTEHMPVFLITAGAYFFLRPILTSSVERAQRADWLVAGIALGLAPWAKLQASVSVCAALVVAVLWSIKTERPGSARAVIRRVLPMVLGLAVPSLFFAGLMVLTDQERTFYQSYLAANLDYTYRGTAKLYLLSELWFFSCESGFFPVIFLGAMTCSLLCWWRSRRKQVPIDSALKWFFGYAVVSFLTVISPGRPFLHYLLFMVPALGVLAGAALVQLLKTVAVEGAERPMREATCAALFALFFLVAFTLVRGQFTIPFAGHLRTEWNRRPSRPAAAAAPYLKNGDTIALWGWRPDVYVELQAPQGVRDAHTQREIENTPFRPYYRQRYLEDLERNKPVAFIDVVGPKAFVFLDRQRFGFETFASLQSYITAHYRLIDDSPLGRVYIRNERLAAAP